MHFCHIISWSSPRNFIQHFCPIRRVEFITLTLNPERITYTSILLPCTTSFIMTGHSRQPQLSNVTRNWIEKDHKKVIRTNLSSIHLLTLSARSQQWTWRARWPGWKKWLVLLRQVDVTQQFLKLFSFLGTNSKRSSALRTRYSRRLTLRRRLALTWTRRARYASRPSLRMASDTFATTATSGAAQDAAERWLSDPIRLVSIHAWLHLSIKWSQKLWFFG